MPTHIAVKHYRRAGRRIVADLVTDGRFLRADIEPHVRSYLEFIIGRVWLNGNEAGRRFEIKRRAESHRRPRGR